MAERLLAHANMWQYVCSEYWNEELAADLKELHPNPLKRLLRASSNRNARTRLTSFNATILIPITGNSAKLVGRDLRTVVKRRRGHGTSSRRVRFHKT